MGIQYPVPHIPMLGKGSVLLDIFDANGNPTGFQHLGNCTKFERDMKDDIAELYQSINSTVTLIATALKKRQIKLTITGTDFSPPHGAIYSMSGGVNTLATAAVAVVGEVLASATASKLGKFFRTATPNINPAIPPVLHSGATVLVAGVDYIIADPVTGVIYIPVTSSEVETNPLTIGYTPLVGTFPQVEGGTVPFQTGHVLFLPDPVDGQKIVSDIWRVNLNPSGQIGLIAEDYGNWTLDGLVLDDSANHPNSPFFLDTYLPSKGNL
jgi:hypothetical protein